MLMMKMMLRQINKFVVVMKILFNNALLVQFIEMSVHLPVSSHSEVTVWLS